MKNSHSGTIMARALSAWLVCASIPAWGKEYFDPRLLSIDGQSVTTDLSAFENSGHIPAGNYLVTLYVNQIAKGDYALDFKPDAQGKIIPMITPALLDELGVNTSALPTLRTLPRDAPLDDLASVIPDAFFSLDFPQLRLDVSIPQIALKPSVAGYSDPSLWDQGVPAMVLNYSLSGGRNWQSLGYGSPDSTQDNLFLSLRSGANWENWRLRSQYIYTYNKGHSSGQPGLRTHTSDFSNTYLQTDIQPWRAELAIGETSTGNDVFDSIAFKGVRLNSNDQMLPINQRGFAPMISGIANTNARVTITQNGNVIYQTYVAPGAFRINDLHQTGLGGDLLLTITEADGSVRTQTIASSSLPVMLRPYISRFEITAGRYDGGVTLHSREAPFVLGTLIYGLPHNFTLYGGTLVADDYLSAAGGIGLSMGSLGALSADVTAARARLDDHEGVRTGNSYRVRYAKNVITTGTSIDLAAYLYSTRDYYSFADFNNAGYELTPGQLPWTLARQRSSFQARINQQLNAWGALYLSHSRYDYWGNDEVNTNIAAGYSTSFHGINYDLAYSVSRVQRQDNSWPETRQIALTLQAPLDLFTGRACLRNSRASYQVSRRNDGELQQQVGLSGSDGQGRLSWNVSHNRSNQDEKASSSNLNLGYQGSNGAANLGYSYSNSYRSLNLNGNGAVVVHPQGMTLSQSTGDSIAVVSAPGAAGASVMNGGVTTDSRGYAVVPYLSNYQSNAISLNPSTLPDDVDLTQSTVNVYPTKGAVVLANFATRIGLQALLTLTYQGQPLPFGTSVEVESSNRSEADTGIVGDAGQVYMNGLPESGTLRARWGAAEDQQCEAHFDFSEQRPEDQNSPIRSQSATCYRIGDEGLLSQRSRIQGVSLP